jgi:hypothetical protein
LDLCESNTFCPLYKKAGVKRKAWIEKMKQKSAYSGINVTDGAAGRRKMNWIAGRAETPPPRGAEMARHGVMERRGGAAFRSA